jgi:hypothetical protein
MKLKLTSGGTTFGNIDELESNGHQAGQSEIPRGFGRSGRIRERKRCVFRHMVAEFGILRHQYLHEASHGAFPHTRSVFSARRFAELGPTRYFRAPYDGRGRPQKKVGFSTPCAQCVLMRIYFFISSFFISSFSIFTSMMWTDPLSAYTWAFTCTWCPSWPLSASGFSTAQDF